MTLKIKEDNVSGLSLLVTSADLVVHPNVDSAEKVAEVVDNRINLSGEIRKGDSFSFDLRVDQYKSGHHKLRVSASYIYRNYSLSSVNYWFNVEFPRQWDVNAETLNVLKKKY